MSKVDILGVGIDRVTMEEAIQRVEEMCLNGKKHQIVTPNPEFVIRAQTDREFRRILNQADLAIPDGVGIMWASRVLTAHKDWIPERVTGTDLMIRLCELAAQKGYSVFLLGGEIGVAQRATEVLRIRYPGLKVLGTYEGEPSDSEKTREKIQQYPEIDFLFVAFGAPQQEKWIAQNVLRLPVKVAMGVGGAFDFIVGKQKRAPRLFQNLGLEWLWRLFIQPWRWRRQLALLKFTVLVVRRRLEMI